MLTEITLIPVHDRYGPVPEEDFYETVFRYVYEPGSLPTNNFIENQNLAILCFILGIGTLADPNKPALSPEATRYYELGCAALSLDSPLEQRSISAIQAVVCRSLRSSPT